MYSPLRSAQAGIASGRQSLVFLPNIINLVTVTSSYLTAMVGGAVVNDDDLNWLVGLLQSAVNSMRQSNRRDYSWG
jgi:hypothetical protein